MARLRTLALTCFGAIAATLASSVANAQSLAEFYRGKTVRVIVGFSSGGGYDQYARLLVRHMGRHTPGNPTYIVQNMPGAASLKSVAYLEQGAPTLADMLCAFVVRSIVAGQLLQRGGAGRLLTSFSNSGLFVYRVLLVTPRSTHAELE